MAMNPTDCKYINCLAPLGVHVGCDYAGIVQEVGKNVNPQVHRGRLYSYLRHTTPYAFTL
ncbi:hypothetical protein AFLA70_155g002430 [Aspergillus flavus AF70]|nr:hypothetical protein AFLA70_155g002430 [Aspergillus flavus AF70]